MEEYLNHHIHLAGSTRKLFSDESIFAIHQASGGLLRKANSLAKTSLLACVMEGIQTVSAEHVRFASTEIFT
jgi:type II secretory pathway predicted ATPase ExeA